MLRDTFLKGHILCLFFFFNINLFSQSVVIKGKVLDSLKMPIPFSNILAEPKNNGALEFAITDDIGNYRLNLQRDNTYLIKVSYLGYKSKILKLTAKKDTVINFLLNERVELLEEIKIDAKLAVSIKKDTITYQTDKFVTGEERKLRDILKKLPGVEVDRAGNVTVQGKKVTKLLVENKQFFTGDSKLAVNNIPADAVDEVEVIDNYTDIVILKGLEDSNDMAMNIKLKKGKKKFWFGDLEGGIGFTDRYLAHPSLFYYSPQTSTNIIGDLNNTGAKSFTFRDYLDFEGGYNKILLNPKAYFSRINDDFSKFLNNKNFTSSEHSFIATSINQSINDKTNLISYIIYSSSDDEQETRTVNEYINQTESLFENRITTSNSKNKFLIGKVALDNTQENGTKLKLQSFVKVSNAENRILNISLFDNINNNINTNTQVGNIDIKQNIEWYYGAFKNHTLTTLANFNIAKGDLLLNWQTNNEVFQDAVPIIDDINFDVFKDKQTSSFNLSLLLKDYWVLGKFMLLQTTGGYEYYYDDYESIEFQKLSNGGTNNFISSGFGNDLESNFTNTYIGTQLKFQKGKFTFKPGIFFHRYIRKLKQFEENFTLHKNYFLPELLIKIDLKRSEKINIRYNLKIRFPSVTRLLLNQTLTGFNSIYKGNPVLQNNVYHQASIYYYNFSFFKNLNYNLSINYRKTEEGIRNTALLEGISFINQPILLDNPDESVILSGSIKKGRNISVQLGTDFSFSNYLQVVNNAISRNKSRSYAIKTVLKTNFEDFPNTTLSYKKSFDNYKTQVSTTHFENDNLNLRLEYDFLKSFIFNIDYNYRRFNNKTTNNQNQNDILNTSLVYQKENSPWSFEISANNIFNNKFIRNSSFSNFLISDTKTFILPRVLMFSIGYNL
tara:strand:+ start:2889 stop:5573 length:2685 start_codon:yes stop_codon:yes gene_type:complete